MAYLGWPSLCFRATDLEKSKQSYSELGMQLIDEVPGKRAVMQYGTFNLALMTFLGSNLLNFRGGDPFAAHARLKSAFPEVAGEPERYTPAQYASPAAGTCWATRDPDGNDLFLDTNATEVGDDYVRRRSIDVLRNAEGELEALGADPELLAALRSQVLDRFSVT